MTKPNMVISLYDYTGEALRPWAEAGYECYAYDIQHKEDRREAVGGGGKSLRTKNIRSATPRGFAKAVYEVNHV